MANNSSDQHNRGGLLAFGFSMAFVFSFFFYLVAINPGVDLDEKVQDPNAVETKEEFNIEKVAQPWVPSDQLVAYGKKAFTANCAVCHGEGGKGDGAAGAALNPKPRNFVEGKWTQGPGIISHFKVIAGGIAGSSMAAFGHLPVGDRWAIAHFIESITQNKSKDTPEQIEAFAKTAK